MPPFEIQVFRPSMRTWLLPSGVAVVASPQVPLLVARWTEPGEVKKNAV